MLPIHCKVHVCTRSPPPHLGTGQQDDASLPSWMASLASWGEANLSVNRQLLKFSAAALSGEGGMKEESHIFLEHEVWRKHGNSRLKTPNKILRIYRNLGFENDGKAEPDIGVVP